MPNTIIFLGEEYQQCEHNSNYFYNFPKSIWIRKISNPEPSYYNLSFEIDNFIVGHNSDEGEVKALEELEKKVKSRLTELYENFVNTKESIMSDTFTIVTTETKSLDQIKNLMQNKSLDFEFKTLREALEEHYSYDTQVTVSELPPEWEAIYQKYKAYRQAEAQLKSEWKQLSCEILAL